MAPDCDNAQPLLCLRDAVVKRSGKNILTVDEFLMQAGESVAILGPNGAGKSTFVKLFTREVFPLHRDIPPVVFRGNPRASLDKVKGCVGVVSSSMQDQISVHLPAVEVVVGGLYGVLGVPRHISATEEDFGYAEEVMSRVGIADLAKRDVLSLSTGQARRVLIARALVREPMALVLDEPCAGLDPSGMYYMRRTMSNLAKEGRSLVLVTHCPEDIVPEIKRVVLIKDGHICSDGAKESLLTDKVMTGLFDVPLHVLRDDDRYAIVDGERV